MIDLHSSQADRVLGIDKEEADLVLAALSSESARQVLTALNNSPATVAELADMTDLTPQNVSYHLGKLDEADLIRTDGTHGAGGNEATIYAPARSVIVSTETDAEHWRPRMSVLGIAIGVLLTLVCLLSLVGPHVDLLAMLGYGLALLSSIIIKV